ncbi:hypothetical protein KKHLCK_09235 [Candidatus Electrothrix laxa]
MRSTKTDSSFSTLSDFAALNPTYSSEREISLRDQIDSVTSEAARQRWCILILDDFGIGNKNVSPISFLCLATLTVEKRKAR